MDEAGRMGNQKGAKGCMVVDCLLNVFMRRPEPPAPNGPASLRAFTSSYYTDIQRANTCWFLIISTFVPRRRPL